MRFQVVDTREWVERIVAFDAVLDARWICDVLAVHAGNRPHPRSEAVALHLSRDRSTVVVAIEDDDLVGYIIGDDDKNGRGGCRGRWISAESPAAIQGLIEVLVERYGWVWGRITNPLIADALVGFGCVSLREDPTIFTYGRP